jgi:HEAT repeat protein
MFRSLLLAGMTCFLIIGITIGQEPEEGDKPSPELAKLIKQFKNYDARRRLDALEKVAKLGAEGRAATPALLDFLTTPKLSPRFQNAALTALEKVNPKVHKPLLSLLLDESTETRTEALTQVDELPEAELKAFYPVILRTFTAERIRSRGDSILLPQYLTLMSTHYAEKPEVADAFIQTIAYNPNARGSAARTQAVTLAPNLTLDRKLYFKALVSALSDDNPEARTAVVKAIGAYKDEARALLPILKRLKFDKTQSVREAASVAVYLIEEEK